MKNSFFIFVFSLLVPALLAATPVTRIIKGSPEYTRIREQIIKAAHDPHVNADHSMHEILPGLYLGDLAAAYNVHKHQHITHVLSILDNPKKIKASGVVWMGLRISDSPHALILPLFNKAFYFIEGATAGVMVHCRAGISRSATFVIAYIMWKFDVSFQEALQYVRTKRPQINPNDGFIAQLKYYEIVRGRSK